MAEGSRVDLLWDDGQDDVLVSSPHHRPQRLVPLYGGADVTGRGDLLAIYADDDITLLQARSVAKKEERRLTKITNKYISDIYGVKWNSTTLQSIISRNNLNISAGGLKWLLNNAD